MSSPEGKVFSSFFWTLKNDGSEVTVGLFFNQTGKRKFIASKCTFKQDVSHNSGANERQRSCMSYNYANDEDSDSNNLSQDS